MLMNMQDTSIVDPASWTVAQVGGREGLTRRFSSDEIATLRALRARLDGREPSGVSRDEFSEPALDRLVDDLRHAVFKGRGVTILSGLPDDLIDEDSLALLFWGLGMHLGTGMPQSYRKDMIGKVQKEIDNPTGRGYLMDVELKPHCDFHRVMGLCGVRSAQSGGESGMVSSIALHDAMAERYPGDLAVLRRGWFQGRHTGSMSEGYVPTFAGEAGAIICFHHPLFYHAAAQRRGEDLPTDLSTAIARLVDLSVDPEFRVEFTLEPGEMLFWHNFTALHSRNAFDNGDGPKRLLLRLWLNAEEGREVPEMFLIPAREMDERHLAGEQGLVYAGLNAMKHLASAED